MQEVRNKLKTWENVTLDVEELAKSLLYYYILVKKIKCHSDNNLPDLR